MPKAKHGSPVIAVMRNGYGVALIAAVPRACLVSQHLVAPS